MEVVYTGSLKNLDNANSCFALFVQDSRDFGVRFETADAEYKVSFTENMPGTCFDNQ